jgi:hypothetical protein
MNNDSLLKYFRPTICMSLITLAFIIVPSFGVISFSQSNESLSDPALANETSFSSLSRELAENQSESDDKSDHEADD